MVVGYGTVSRPSKRPPIKIKRFCGGAVVKLGVCSKAVRRVVYMSQLDQSKCIVKLPLMDDYQILNARGASPTER